MNATIIMPVRPGGKVNVGHAAICYQLGLSTETIAYIEGCTQAAVYAVLKRRGFNFRSQKSHLEPWPKWRPPYRFCGYCWQILPSSAFFGRTRRCRECTKPLSRTRFERTKERCMKRAAAWMKAHPEYRAQRHAQYRGRKLGASGHCSVTQWKARCEYFGWRCVYCGVRVERGVNLTQDHVIPLIRGGSNWPSNLVPACRSCNAHKVDNDAPPRVI